MRSEKVIYLFVGICGFVLALAAALPSIRAWSYEHAEYASDLIATAELAAIWVKTTPSFEDIHSSR
jgi:hypothetical protein